MVVSLVLGAKNIKDESKRKKEAAKNIVKSKKGAPDFEKSYKAYKKEFYTMSGKPVATKKEIDKNIAITPFRYLAKKIAKSQAPDKVLTKKEFREEFNKQIEEKQPFKTGGLIKKSRGGIISGNDLVASFYNRGGK